MSKKKTKWLNRIKAQAELDKQKAIINAVSELRLPAEAKSTESALHIFDQRESEQTRYFWHTMLFFVSALFATLFLIMADSYNPAVATNNNPDFNLIEQKTIDPFVSYKEVGLDIYDSIPDLDYHIQNYTVQLPVLPELPPTYDDPVNQQTRITPANPAHPDYYCKWVSCSGPPTKI